MLDSMDIIEFIENDERFGPTNVLRPASGRTDLKEWQKTVKFLLRTLQRPRYVATGLLPEFQQLDSRHKCIAKYPLPPFDTPEWNEMEDFSEKLSNYAEAMANACCARRYRILRYLLYRGWFVPRRYLFLGPFEIN